MAMWCSLVYRGQQGDWRSISTVLHTCTSAASGGGEPSTEHLFLYTLHYVKALPQELHTVGNNRHFGI